MSIIIAEAGVNHNGSLELAKRLALAAKKAGADYVKYQTFVPERIVSRFAEKAAYQTKTTGGGSQLDMLRKLALSFDDFRKLATYCHELEIGFLSTAFDMESIAFLEELGMELWKVPSGEVTNLPYLLRIAKTGKPVILSTGMCEENEIAEAVCALRKGGAESITLLHCTTEYPAPLEDVNLLAMNAMRQHFSLPVGYSDHTEGIAVPVAAAALGACMIEKHFTLDRTMEGPDHKASLEPQELCVMVDAVHRVERALGTPFKRCTDSERGNRAVARKSIVAARSIRAGETFTEENLTVKRPGTGISPMRWYEVLGQRATRNYDQDEIIL